MAFFKDREGGADNPGGPGGHRLEPIRANAVLGSTLLPALEAPARGSALPTRRILPRRAPRLRHAPTPILATAAWIALALGCGKDSGGAPGSGRRSEFQTAAAERQDLVVTAAATGILEPIRVVEVKSKASGEILKLTVESGDKVEKAALLAQLDQKDTKNQYARAKAEVEVARARFRIAEGQLARSKQLLERQTISAQEHEGVLLEHANANAALVTAEIDLDLARERLAETTVRAPSAGVIISKAVEEGQIISSATSQVTGGTTLLMMAALDEVQVRALVDEVDIGRIHAGQEARIRVDAHPEMLFTGTVLKVEPQAVVEQNVTTFPVLVRIPNERGLLLPGMNCEVEIEILRRENVLTVPNEAVRSRTEAEQTAAALGVGVEGLESLSRGAAHAATAPRDSLPGREPGGRAGSGRGGRPSVVFVVDQGNQLAAREVKIGARNWDDTEIASGLTEGERVALLPSTQLLREQAQFRERMQQVGSVPGLQRQPEGGGTQGAPSGGPR
jgi:HlyD family secretion protein